MTDADGAQQDQQGVRRDRRNVAILLLVLLILGGLWLLWWILVGSQRVRSNDAYVAGNISPVPAQVAGTIRRVFFQNTQFVRAGTVLASVQGDGARLAWQSSAAILARTVRQVRQEFANVIQVQSEQVAQQTKLAKLQIDLQRYQQAEKSGAVASIQISNVDQDIRGVQAQLGATQARLQAAQALVAGTTLRSNPQVRAAAASFARAYIAWQRRDIRAPISGFVAQRAVYPGQRVRSGERCFDIVPLQPLWVVANIKETEMRAVRPGQEVTMNSDYYGGHVTYHGRVEGLLPGAGSAFSILPPENATGNYIHIVERVPVRISLPNKELAQHPLRPGLSMVVSIQIHGRARQYSVVQPLTQTPIDVYRSQIADQQMQAAQQAANAIIRANAGGGQT